MRWAVWFNKKIDQLKNQYIKIVQTSIRYSKSVIVIFVALIAVFALFYSGLKSGFIPKEDQGILSVQIKLVDSAPISQSQKIGEQVRQYFLTQEDKNVDLVLIRYGRNYSGTGQNLAQGFIALKPWDVRTGKEKFS